MPLPSLRRATSADAEAIAALNVAAARAGWTDFLSEEVLERFELPVERWRTRLEEGDPGSAVLVAVESGQILGFVSLRAQAHGPEPAGEIGALYTDPAIWSRGVGRFLLDAALAELRAAGCGEAVLWTEERNARARRVYERLGWRADGEARERVFLGHPIREIAYRLSLEPGDAGRDGAARTRA